MLALMTPLAFAFLANSSGVAPQAGVIAGFSVASAQAGKAVTVRNSQELQNALKNPAAGSTILLAPGTYTSIAMSNRIFTEGLTLASLDPSKPVTIEAVRLNNISNMRFRSVRIGRALRSGEPSYTKMAEVLNSKTIVFDDVKFAGSIDGNPYNDGYGIRIGSSDDVTVSNSRFTDLFLATSVDKSTNVNILRNDYRTLKLDAMNFDSSDNLLIEGNFITDILWREPDHPDGIQLWARGKTSQNIVIKDNIVLQGRGRGVQGIFLRAAAETPFRNVRIENNLVYGADQYNGIMVENGEQLEIIGNSSLSPSNDQKTFWIRLESVKSATVKNNVADQFVLDNNGRKSTGLRLENNVFLKEKPQLSKQIVDLNKLATAQASRLTLPNVGYLSFGSFSSQSNVSSEPLQASAIPGAGTLSADASPLTSAPVRKITPTPVAKPTVQTTPQITTREQLIARLRGSKPQN